jgi:hypothetical protein
MEVSGPLRCICQLFEFSWEDVLEREKVLGFGPFSAIKEGALLQCHLCSLLYGSLRVYNGPVGTVKLQPDCVCVTENNSPFRIYGNSNYIVIEVLCDGPKHVAILGLSTKPHNC